MPADATSPLTFAVGDIHGCLDKLDRLLAACEVHAGARLARYVFLGDYIDRGPQSRGVIDRLMAKQVARPGTVVCLRGNHEQMAIDAHASARAVPLWLANNGLSTLRNYGGRRISPEHLAWLNALPFCHDDGLRFFVHAGIDLTVPLAAQAAEVMVWMRVHSAALMLWRCSKGPAGKWAFRRRSGSIKAPNLYHAIWICGLISVA
jgi:calcineurin-like phosphoesterase family protein